MGKGRLETFSDGVITVSYTIGTIVAVRAQGPASAIAKAIGSDRKGKFSLIIYCVLIPTAFVSPLISCVLFAAVALIRFVPDKRIERIIG